MELFNLRDVNNRIKRRKQSQVGRFKKDHLSVKPQDADYTIEEVSPEKLKKIKEEIQSKSRRTARLQWVITLLVCALFLYYIFRFIFQL